MSGEHTPGPWTVNAIQYSSTSRVTHEVFARLRYVASVNDADDARLIAAAPDLLEALEEKVRLCTNGCALDFFESCCESAVAAIAKAKGGAPGHPSGGAP